MGHRKINIISEHNLKYKLLKGKINRSITPLTFYSFKKLISQRDKTNNMIIEHGNSKDLVINWEKTIYNVKRILYKKMRSDAP